MKVRIRKIIFMILIVVFSYVIIELSLDTISLRVIIRRFFKAKKITALSISLLLSLALLLLGIFNNKIIAYGTFLTMIFSFTIANNQKIKFRNEPIFPHDLKEIINFYDLFKMMDPIVMIIAVTVVFLLIVFLFRLNKSEYFKSNRKFFTQYNYRILSIGGAFVILVSLFGINSYNSSLKELLYSSGFKYARWDSLKTYRDNGTVIGFIHNFPGRVMEKPSGYNKRKMEEIENKYLRIANEINIERENQDFSNINVVYILSESLSSPSRIPGLALSSNPIEYIQTPDKNATGKLLVPSYGGGTANVEFEVLTSLSTMFLLPNMSLAYQNVIPNLGDFPSIAWETKNNTRPAIAAHSYHSNFYQRRKVFNKLGFDQQIFENEFENNQSIGKGKYISDESSYKEILSILKRHESSFIHFITMQNHTPYQDIYDDYPISIISDNNVNLEKIEYYIEGLRQTDLATKEFIREIELLDQNTIVVFYGDHLPPLYSDFLSKEHIIEKYSTDFFVFSNFSNQRIEIDELTPTYYLNNLVYELANVKVPPFLAFIESFNQEFNGIVGKNYILKNGDLKTYDKLNMKQKELVDTFNLIQYDVIEGECYFTEMCRLDGLR